MGNNFGVGFTPEGNALFSEPCLEFRVIFYDTVMHNGDLSRHVGVGMGVLVRRLAVGRPAGMADSHGSPDNFRGYFLFKKFERALGFTDYQSFVAQNGNTGGVVTAVFKFF